MNISLENLENKTYSSVAYDAVRYGYQYRKEAEKHANSVSGTLHHCLPEPSALLGNLADIIIDGIAFDLFKKLVRKIWTKIKERKSIKENTEVYSLLSDEESLEQFYLNVKEFLNNEMNITTIQEKYIKEEVIADYTGDKVSKIYQQYKRLPTTQELIVIHREAYQRAESIIVRKK